VAVASNLDKAKNIFQKLDKNHLSLIEEFYDPNIEFQDPVHALSGVKAMRAYYAGLYENVSSIRFEFTRTLSEGDTVVLVWKMFLVTKSLNGGKEFSVDGNSVIQFNPKNGKAIYHRDYFDMGEFIYERVPVLRSIIEYIKNKMKS
jgi:ketosteroid isomerase-like protein